jgi:hypothetical protein
MAAEDFDLAGVVLQVDGPERHGRLARLARCRPPRRLLPVHRTASISDEATVGFRRGLAPDIVLVNGTQLLRQPFLFLIAGIRHGFVHRHRRWAPYSCGPNEGL